MYSKNVIIFVYLCYFYTVKHLYRSHAIGCVNQFIVQKTPSLMNHIDVFLEVIFLFVVMLCFISKNIK